VELATKKPGMILDFHDFRQAFFGTGFVTIET